EHGLTREVAERPHRQRELRVGMDVVVVDVQVRDANIVRLHRRGYYPPGRVAPLGTRALAVQVEARLASLQVHAGRRQQSNPGTGQAFGEWRPHGVPFARERAAALIRSEERRVGKEGESGE